MTMIRKIKTTLDGPVVKVEFDGEIYEWDMRDDMNPDDPPSITPEQRAFDFLRHIVDDMNNEEYDYWLDELEGVFYTLGGSTMPVTQQDFWHKVNGR